MKSKMKLKGSIFVLVPIAIILLQSISFGQLLFEKEEYALRRQKLMDRIPDGIGIIFGARTATANYGNFQNNDFMYFTGVEIPNSVLIIDGKRRESVIFFAISERQARGENLSLDLVRRPIEVTGIEKAYPLERFSSYLSQQFTNHLSRQKEVASNFFYTIYTPFKPEELMRETSNSKLRVLLDSMTYNEWDERLTRELQLVEHLKKRFPRISVKDCSEMIWDLRMIKSPAEIAFMREAARIGVKAHIEVMKSARPGVPEHELAALFEFICKKEGAQDLAFRTIISSEENHPFLHYNKYNRVLQDGDFLVVDAGPDFGYYDTDISISFPANGRFSPRQQELYEACNEIHKACMSLYTPGITCMEIGAKAREVLEKEGYDLSKDVFTEMRYFKEGSCTHFVGMATHDSGGPDLDFNGPMVPGMVIACDTFAVFPEENLGVRIEDTVLITEDGYENLSEGLPREIEEIEALMKNQGILQMIEKNEKRSGKEAKNL
jgi:Xaa-Pro aminopeptidase